MPADMFFGATPIIFANAKQLRKALTPAEMLLQRKLKEHFPDYRFRAQHPINYFIANFYCHHAKLIIEVDGSVHDMADQIEYDANRTYMLEESGLTVSRFRNEEVEQDSNRILTKINQLLPKPPQPPKGD
ncbi:endonuclease domain-containing protein [Fibrella arboris]|uniref:endonuclease domain-containing protein n=1 Tax=Fibrella arboris TaxID=3242486 RepID=UPI003521E69A